MPKQTVCFVSDTHCHHEFTADLADVLIHCGDAANYGGIREVVEAVEWLDRQPHKHVAFLPGNHDRCMELEDMWWLLRKMYPRVVLLEPGMNVVGDLTVAAAPWMDLYDWAFYTQQDQIMRNVEQMLALKGQPHILVSHAPPMGTLDSVPDRISHRTGTHRPGGHVGQKWYQRLAARLGAQVHAFGHIHEHGGEKLVGTAERGDEGVTYVNAARLGRDYESPLHNGIIVEVQT